MLRSRAAHPGLCCTLAACVPSDRGESASEATTDAACMATLPGSGDATSPQWFDNAEGASERAIYDDPLLFTALEECASVCESATTS